jgi:hypothetical protein
MYASQVKLLLRYLVYNCDTPGTYISLSLVNKYCAKLTKYYSPMKRTEFCKEIKWELAHGRGEISTVYMLPNGQILKHVSIFGANNTKSTTYFDIKTFTSVYVSERKTSPCYYLDNDNLKHCEYFYNNKLYSVEDNYVSIKFVTGPKAKAVRHEFSSERCRHCKHFHDFTVILDRYKYFNIFRHCGSKSVKYLYFNVKPHLKRRKVIHAVIQYARNMKSDSLLL